jgi:nucleoside-diphosphate-sugar epimerase
VRVGDGTNRVDLTFVDHAARAHLLAAARLGPDSPVAGQAYFVGDREPVVLWDWINALLCRAGIAPVRRALSYRAARRLGAALEWLYRACPWLGEPPMTRFVAAQLAHSHYFSHEKARRELGYEPHVPPEEAMTRLFEWPSRIEHRQTPHRADSGGPVAPQPARPGRLADATEKDTTACRFVRSGPCPPIT